MDNLKKAQTPKAIMFTPVSNELENWIEAQAKAESRTKANYVNRVLTLAMQSSKEEPNETL